jgi:hypothetical protein
VRNHLQFCRRILGYRHIDRRVKCGYIGPFESASAEVFALHLIQRYTDFQRYAPRLAWLLRRPLSGADVQQVQRFTQFNLTPKLALTVLNWSVDERVFVTSTVIRQKMLSVYHTTVEKGKPSFENTIHQLYHRVERGETANHPFSSSRSKSNRMNASNPKRMPLDFSPVQKIFQVQPSQSTSTEPGTQKVSQSSALADWQSNQPNRLPSRWTASGAQPSGLADLAPKDIDHLTNEVIRTIDQRILAQRERLGRV